MSARMVVHRRDNLKAVLSIERRCLKREGREDNLPAAPSSSLLLHCLDPGRPQPLPASHLLHPELPDFATATPRVSANPGNDSIVIVPDENRQPLAVRLAGGRGLALLEPVFQVLNLGWRGLSIDDEFWITRCLWVHGVHAGVS